MQSLEEYPFAQEFITDAQGQDNAYRIRVGDYRIGIFIDNEIITFARVQHRRDIYLSFP